MFIFLIAEGCEIIYVGTGRETSVDVELACTSNTGLKQTVAEYQAVECPRNNDDDDDG